jgi:hypothetical protein
MLAAWHTSDPQWLQCRGWLRELCHAEKSCVCQDGRESASVVVTARRRKTGIWGLVAAVLTTLAVGGNGVDNRHLRGGWRGGLSEVLALGATTGGGHGN